MSYDITKWIKLPPLKSDPDPTAGDLVHVTPRGDMAGHVMCGAIYIGGHQVSVSEDAAAPGEPRTTVHEVLFNGSIMTVSSHSHRILVVEKNG